MGSDRVEVLTIHCITSRFLDIRSSDKKFKLKLNAVRDKQIPLLFIATSILLGLDLLTAT